MHKAILAFLASFASLLALGGGGMNIGMRIGAWSGGGKQTARDYVQDGLVFLYDAKDNDDYGKHSDSNSVRNLVTGTVSQCYGSLKNNGDHFSWDGVSHGNFLCENNEAFKSSITGKSATLTGLFQVDSITATAGGNNFTFFGSFSMSIRSNSGNLSYLNYLQFGGTQTTCKPYLTPKYAQPFKVDITYDGARIKAYLDGLLVSNKAFSVASPVVSQINVGDWGTTQGNHIIFKGKFMTTSFYSRPLTDSEIAANYAVDKARFNLS